MTYPLDTILEGSFILIAWSIILMIIQLRTHNAMLTSFVGLFIASFLVATPAFIGEQNEKISNVAWLLVAISMGSSLFFMIRTKASQPQTV